MFMAGTTLKWLFAAYEYRLLEKWDHTSLIASQLHNIACLIISAAGGKKVQPKTPSHFHPYREKTRIAGMAIREDNFTDLKMLGNALCAS